MATHEKLKNPDLQALIDEGEQLKTKITHLLRDWPKDETGNYIAGPTHPDHALWQKNLKIELHRWFNTVKQKVLPSVLVLDSHSSLENVALSIVRLITPPYRGEIHPNPQDEKSSIERQVPIIEEVLQQLDYFIEEILDIIRAVPDTPQTSALSLVLSQPSLTIRPNTAFILMWMDPAKAELEDVVNTFKEIFAEFGIQALRADDVQHQDKITDIILEHIRTSEFLIADLTGERPNVYYEVGYAHAIGKRPILFRKKGTALHFDLSVHNVPEYGKYYCIKDIATKTIRGNNWKRLREELKKFA